MSRSSLPFLVDRAFSTNSLVLQFFAVVMHFLRVNVIWLAAGTAQLAKAHTALTNFFIDGVNQGDGTAVRMSNNMGKATFPINSITSPDMACGVNGEAGVARIAATKAGSTITFEWREWPDGSQPGSIDISHKGPCAVYMKKVDNAAANNNAAGGGWFKIMEDGYDSAANKWCTEKLDPNNGHLAATIPSDLAPGYYLMRPELLALHQADKTPPDPQFYVGCAQIFLSSGGSATTKSTVSIPGYVDLKTPAMTYNVWQVPLKLPFPGFGPPVYIAGSAKRDVKGLTLAQTIGLKPATCVMQNANWCAFLPPKYIDQDGCWSASKNCSTQTEACYKSAGPTGSKNCHNWEDYCTDIRNACDASNFNGPPPFKTYIPTQLPALSGGVVSAKGPMASAPSSTAASGHSASSVSLAYSPPVATPVPASNDSVTAGSNDTCGSNGGQTCKAGMCCSCHGSKFHLPWVRATPSSSNHPTPTSSIPQGPPPTQTTSAARKARPVIGGKGVLGTGGKVGLAGKGMGLGKGGMRRHRKIMKDSIKGITKGDIR
ncbi:MAG: hypothetical protein Q9217_002401, partial [Psora testacea]